MRTYKILKAKTVEDLERDVQCYLQNGWVLSGNLVIRDVREHRNYGNVLVTYYYQAVTYNEQTNSRN